MFVVNNKNKKVNVEPGTNKLILVGRPAEQVEIMPAKLLKKAPAKVLPKPEAPNTAAAGTTFEVY